MKWKGGTIMLELFMICLVGIIIGGTYETLMYAYENTAYAYETIESDYE